MTSTRTARIIHAPRETIFAALLDPAALETWRVPGDMTAKVHEYDPRTGGGYRMSLFYPETAADNLGKTGGREDRYTARYLEIVPPSRIVEAIVFDTTDPGFAGEMTMIVTLEEIGSSTEVTFAFENLPSGVRPEDNDLGTRLSLEKLARYVEGEARSL
jgi:uncharacterized protein YndB with AHSA1/START domain